MLDGAQQLRVSLAHDLIEFHGLHAGVNKLLERLTGFDALVLPHVADEQDAVAGVELPKEIAHLLGAGQARLIDHVKMALRS